MRGYGAGMEMDMETKQVIRATDLKKRFKGFELSIPGLQIPQGFATALIGQLFSSPLDDKAGGGDQRTAVWEFSQRQISCNL